MNNDIAQKLEGIESHLASKLLDNLSTSILLVCPDMTIIYLNPAAQSLLATSGSRLSDLPVEQIFNEDPQSALDLKRALETGHPYTKREAILSTPPGNKTITVDYSVTPITLEHTAFECTSHNDSAPRPYHLLVEIQQLDRLLRISRDESQFSTHQATRSLIKGVAHEIKNPLGGILGAAQLLGRELQELGATDSHDLQDYIDVITGETDRLRTLVDKMLGPNQLPNMELVNIHYALERVKQVIDAESQGRVTVKRDYDTSLPELYADADQLIQSCLNITRNALEAHPSDNAPSTLQKEKTITLRTRVDYHLTIGSTHHRLVLRISIIDNGPGISESVRETLFYPMISGRADGTGLGLSIAQSLIRRHHGLIECTSEPNNTIFNIFLPLESPQ